MYIILIIILFILFVSSQLEKILIKINSKIINLFNNEEEILQINTTKYTYYKYILLWFKDVHPNYNTSEIDIKLIPIINQNNKNEKYLIKIKGKKKR